MAVFHGLKRLAISGGRHVAFDFPVLSVILAGMALAWLSMILGDSGFSPDSWAYFELAKTIFSDHFYQFNTYRSYFSEAQSASFPFGYPFVIALAHVIFGIDPMVAVAVNILSVIVTALLIINICRKNAVPEVAQVALVLSLLLYDGYTDEALFGRSIPLAILCFVAAFRLLMAERLFAAGLLLGASALIRFDFLVFGILLLMAMPLLGKWQGYRIALAPAGFIIGIVPWVIYSLLYFGKPWVSDNSWIALSSLPAYVADYPAGAESNLFNAPGQWLIRVLSNVPQFLKYLVLWSFNYPLLMAMAAFAVHCWIDGKCRIEKKMIMIFAIFFLSIIPYLLTRYFDARYFSLLFLALSFFLMIRLCNYYVVGLDVSRITLLSVVITLALAVRFVGAYFHDAELVREKRPLEDKFIATLLACQKSHPEVKYIFQGEVVRLAPRYGATTGGLAAFIPSNFNRMSEQEKQVYFDKMQPYVLIDKVTEAYPCHR